MLRISLGAVAVLAAICVFLNMQVTDLRRDLGEAASMFGQCETLLTATMEGDEINASIPDDLRNYDPSRWLLPE